MDCDFTEKVSRLLDGELGPEESSRVSEHVAACAVCRQAQADFLFLRERIKSYDPGIDPAARRQALGHILKPGAVSRWRKRITLPVPVLAALLAAVAALAAWAAFLQSRVNQNVGVKRVAGEAVASRAGEPSIDLTRFDRGQRAIIYTVRRGASCGER